MGARDGQICSEDGCTRPVHARRLCSSDYKLAWLAGLVGKSALPASPPDAVPLEPELARFPPAPSFRLRGLCARDDPERWFPRPSDAAAIEAAKAVCSRCPVRAECAGYALRVQEPWGIWGGLSEADRLAAVAA